MSLKAKLSGEEFGSLDESLQGFYKESGEGYVLDAEGIEDVGGLKSALEKERKARAKAEKDAKSVKDQYGDLDLDAAREAMEKLRELEEGQLKDAGKFEEAFNKRTERLKADYESQISGHVKKFETTYTELESLRSEMTSLKIDGALREAATKAGVKPAALTDVIFRGRSVFKLEDGQPVPYKGESVWFGKDAGSPMTIDEWVGVLKQEAGHLFDEATGGGSRASYGSSGNNIKITMAQASDARTYKSMKEKADKAGVKLQIVE